jgi:hypothetical protein
MDAEIFSSVLQSRLEVQICTDITECMNGRTLSYNDISDATHFPMLRKQVQTDGKKYMQEFTSIIKNTRYYSISMQAWAIVYLLLLPFDGNID